MRLLVLGLGFEHGGIVTTFKALLPALRAASWAHHASACFAARFARWISAAQ